MRERVAWVLNLDAELELIDPQHVRSDRMRQTIFERARWLLPRIRAATGTDPVLVDGDLGWPPPARGDTWCPTPRALARLSASGVPPPDAPPERVLREVNHRAFAARLGFLLPGAGFVTDEAACARLLAADPARQWLLKRPLGFSGRMRKVVVPRAIDAAARTWIAASMAQYGRGLMVEPLVERVADFSLHGRLAREGSVVRGRPVTVENHADGAFADARPAGANELLAGELDALRAAFDRAADALARAGYFGPFCIDAFRWRDPDGTLHFHALSELNARFTMGWWTGMGDG